MVEPIEITPGDIIRRPENLPVKQTGAGDIVSSIKTYIKMYKEVKAVAAELGIDITGILAKFAGGKFPPQSEGSAVGLDNGLAAPGANQQMQMVLKLLASKYGNETLNGLIEQIRKEYGDKKIKDLIK